MVDILSMNRFDQQSYRDHLPILHGTKLVTLRACSCKGKTDDKPTDYRMIAHLFGARSSPGCVNLALRTTAKMFAKAGSKAADYIRHNCYVTDDLTSVQS